MIGDVQILGQSFGGGTFDGIYNVPNEEASTMHLYVNVEPTDIACDGILTSGLFFRWGYNSYPVVDFGICDKIDMDLSSGLPAWGGITDPFGGIPGFNGFRFDPNLDAFKMIHRASSLIKLADMQKIADMNFTFGHIGLDWNTGIPNLGDFGYDLSGWNTGGSFNFNGVSLLSLNLTGLFPNGCNEDSPCQYRLPNSGARRRTSRSTTSTFCLTFLI